MNKIIESKGTTKNLMFCFNVLDDIKLFNNITVAKKYNLEPSLISRVRGKHTWFSVWDRYNEVQRLSERSTIEANAIGKAENPTEGVSGIMI